MAKIVEAEYIENFKCIGPECEDDCCHGWIVYIDEETFKKYNETDDRSMQEKFKEYLKKNENSKDGFSYAVMNMKKNGRCPMQEESGLCEIHRKKGADFLSATCYVYPKICNIISGEEEISGTISCPEIARKVLLNMEKIEFITKERNSINPKILNTIIKKIENNNIQTGWKKYIKEIRTAAIEIIQNRESKLIERVLYLGLFMKKISEKSEKGKEEDILIIIKQYLEKLRQNKELKISKEIHSNSRIQFEILKSVCEARIEMGEEFRYIYDILYKNFQFGNKNIEETVKNYEKNYYIYVRRFFNENEYIFENFLVNEIFQNMFPYGENIFKSYFELVLKYSLLRYIVMAFAVEKEEISSEVVIDAAYKYSRVFEHSQIFMDEMYRRFRESGFDNLSYMTLIMKI